MIVIGPFDMNNSAKSNPYAKIRGPNRFRRKKGVVKL